MTHMLLKLKNLALALLLASGLLFILAPVATTSALDCDASTKNAIQCGSNNVSGTTGNAQKTVNDTITSVINILSVIVGIVAVIMIIFGGFRYVTSAGDTTKVAGAKNTILYAVIGLVIVALAQVIAKFVLGKATKVAP